MEIDDHKTEGMVALLPTSSDWCKIELPHCTIVYLGDISDRSPAEFNTLGKLASSISMMTGPVPVKVMDTEVLGDVEQVNVLKLEPSPQLKALRQFFEMWDMSEFDFHPHATIGPVNEPVPEFPPMILVFDRIMVAWGDESLIFNLKGGGY
jgi:2'-5' RNA ligase